MSFLIPAILSVLAYLLIDLIVPEVRFPEDFSKSARIREALFVVASLLTIVSWAAWVILYA